MKTTKQDMIFLVAELALVLGEVAAEAMGRDDLARACSVASVVLTLVELWWG